MEKINASHEDNEPSSSILLHRFVDLHDQHRTQIFTFLILPHLFCGLVTNCESRSFEYADFDWLLRVTSSSNVSRRGSNDHLGVFLESVSLIDQDSISIHLDFNITLINRHSARDNVVFSKQSVLFTPVYSIHGKSKLIRLTTLSSRHFLHESGWCQLELEMTSPNVTILLPALTCPDPLSFGQNTEGSTSSTLPTLTRMDGSRVQLPKSLHLESLKFHLARFNWHVTIDLEIAHEGTPGQLRVDLEISLLRQCDTAYWHRINCRAYLPAGIELDQLTFCIGPHGWPLHAHRVAIKSNQSINRSSVLNVDQETLRTFLLSVRSSNFALQLTQLTCLKASLINLTLPLNNTKRPCSNQPLALIDNSVELIDPLNEPWLISLNISQRLLRLVVAKSRSSLKASLIGCRFHLLHKTALMLSRVQGQLNPKPIEIFEPQIQSIRPQSSLSLKLKKTEIAFNLTLDEALDPDNNLVNTTNGVLALEVEWLYAHWLVESNFNRFDLIALRQGHQMRKELKQLQAENAELERRLLASDLGLVQLDRSQLGISGVSPCRDYGPRSRLPASLLHRRRTDDFIGGVDKVIANSSSNSLTDDNSSVGVDRAMSERSRTLRQSSTLSINRREQCNQQEKLTIDSFRTRRGDNGRELTNRTRDFDRRNRDCQHHEREPRSSSIGLDRAASA